MPARLPRAMREAGCTVHEVTAELDAGPILGQARVPVLPGDTEASLAARVLAQEHRLYPAVLRRFAAGDRTPVFSDGSAGPELCRAHRLAVSATVPASEITFLIGTRP